MKEGDWVRVSSTKYPFKTGKIIKIFKHKSVVQFDFNGLSRSIKNDKIEVIEELEE